MSEKSIGVVEDSKNPIPAAEFIKDCKEYLLKKKVEHKDCLRALHMIYNKYKYIETKLLQQKKMMLQKIPDIKKTTDCINFLIKRKESEQKFEADYQLSDNLFAKAHVDAEQDRVFLWLGANVMLEYNYSDAKALLAKNLENAKAHCKRVSEDLEFLKDQLTISEVNIARMHNYGVSLRKAAKKQ
mmetsp:Transcript_4353/g.6527  ORF Transcript_4353/g.6527 Transcript_4353/m.6527 type:complete len:185 (-) Transcript_4353:100-654(-)